MSSPMLVMKIMGDEQLREMLDRAVTEFPQHVLELGWMSAYTMERELRSKYSEGPLFARAASAGLSGSTHAYAEFRGGRLDAGVGVNKFYALVQEEGREIWPVNRKALHFVNQNTGEEVFTKGPVTIPAREPAKQAAIEAEPQVREIWERGLPKFVGGN